MIQIWISNEQLAQHVVFSYQIGRINHMWIPSPIYERVPQFWLLLGLLFFAFGLYLGFEFSLIFIYLGIGILCVARSAWIFQVRYKNRSQENSLAGRLR